MVRRAAHRRTRVHRSGAKAIARRALREVNKIKSNIETHFLNGAFSVSPVFAAPTVTHISAITAGDAVGNRSGDMVSMVSLQIRGAIELTDPTGIFENECVRIIVFIDKTGEVVRTDLDELLADENTLLSMRDAVHMNDFRVLMDKTVTFQNLSLNTDSSLRFFQFFKRFKRPVKIRYLGTASNTVEENQVYMGIQVLQSVAANSVEVNGRTLIKFTDL